MSMALPDDEQRRLAEIERGLAEDDPRLARRFAQGSPATRGAFPAVITAAGLMLGTGLVIIVVGFRLGAPLVIVIGAIIAVIVPALAWLARRKRVG
jgi:Flp pilus assembly protein TadB